MDPLLSIQTPRTEAGTINSIDAEELTFGSREPSFISPNKKDSWKSFKALSTPAPSRVFLDRTNTLNNVKHEFTPLLQSAVKNKIPSHFDPQKKQESEENHTENGISDSLNNSTQEISSSSIVSVKSIVNLPERNSIEKEENIIDTMRKENWGLKLKVHFLNDRLDKLAPDQIEVALKENIENKIHQAKLIQEIKKYKKSLLESEKKVKIMSTNKEKDLELDSIISEQKKILDKIALENNKYADELFQAQEKIEILSKEIEELRSSKNDVNVSEKLIHLQEQLQETLEKNEDMRIELQEMQNKIDEQNDEIELQEEERDKLKQIIDELEQKCFLIKQKEETSEYDDTINSLKNDLDIIKKELNEKEEIIQKFILEKNDSDKLYSELEKTRSDLDKISAEYSELKNAQQKKIYDLEKSCKDINDELEAKKEEIVFLHKQLDAKEFSISDKNGNMQKIQDILNEKYRLEENLKEAHDNIEELHVNLEEYDDRQEELENNLKQKDEQLNEAMFNLESLQNEFDAFKLEYVNEKKDIYNQITKSKQNWDEEKRKLINASFIIETESIQAFLKEYKDSSERTLLTLQEEKDILQKKFEEIKQQNFDLQENINKLTLTESIFSKNNEKFQEMLQNEEYYRVREIQLQNQINEQNILYEDQKKELDDKRILNKSLTVNYTELQQQYTKQQEVIEETNNEAIRFRKEYEKLKIEYELIETALKNLYNEKKELFLAEQIRINNKKDINTSFPLDRLIKILGNQLEFIKADRDKFLESINSLNEDIINYKNTISDLEKERDSLKEKLDTDIYEKQSLLSNEKYFELQKNTNILETQIKLLETDRKKLLETNTDLENRLNEIVENMNEENLIHKYKTKEVELQEIIHAKEYEQEKLQKQINQLEIAISDKEKNHRIKIKQLNDEISLLQSQLQSFELQQKKLLESENSDEHIISSLQKDILDLRKELYDAKMKAINQNTNCLIDNYEIELSELRLKYKNASDMISNLRLEALAHEEEFQNKINEIVLKEKSKLMKLQNEKAQTELALFSVTQEKDALEKEKEHFKKQLSLLEANAAFAHECCTNENENAKVSQEKELKKCLMLTKTELNDVKKNIKVRETYLKEQLYKVNKDKQLLINKMELAEQEIQLITQEKDELSKKVSHLEKQLEENEHFLYSNQNHLKKVMNINNLLPKELFSLKLKHKAELKGLSKQIYYLKARISREEQFRASLSYTKNNQANLKLIEKMGIYPDRSYRQNRITLKVVVLAIIIIGRMKKLSAEWSKQTKIKEKLFNELIYTLWTP
ncbi:hypothetical protein PORY_002321 [Pneumocystis oryctolagi]|uniref:Uncharacterized protein n=1 Tax=Pneumocystis oryctolagi TaxID=42067 RepID=A0ACB7C9X9_9ASCO|nr:hypothetical protein PORY_002321 [Pneumocystis oryctolagi]